MKAPQLETDNPDIRLVEPDIERDAALGVKWLEGEIGRNTLSLMGVADKDNNPSTLEQERKRVKGFIEKDDQLNWMIQLDNEVVGSIWVDLEPTEKLPAPAVHIMVGDPQARGRGAGKASTAAAVGYLTEKGEKTIYSRSLAQNNAAAKLLLEGGFKPLGEPYEDADGLKWQNAVLKVQK